MNGQLDLAVGTAIGSNITNILLILGLSALIHPFTVHSDVLRRELPLMLLVSILAASVLYDGQLSRSDGFFLLLLAVLWLLFIVKIARLAERQGNDSLTREQIAELPREGGLPVAFLWLGIALIIMPMATRMVVDNATVLANYFAMSELTIGLTVVALVPACRNWQRRLRVCVKVKTILPSVTLSARTFLILLSSSGYRR